MPLTDLEILAAIEQGVIGIDPKPSDIQPSSVDLHLHAVFMQIRPGLFDPTLERSPSVKEIPTNKIDGYVLNPGQFLLGATLESIRLPRNMVGIVTGKSSLARIGLQIEAAGYVDQGWDGRLTLELYNMGPLMIMLRARMPICQIRFVRTATPNHTYGDPELKSHYQGSLGPVAGYFDPLNPVRRSVVVDATVIEAKAIESSSEVAHDEE